MINILIENRVYCHYEIIESVILKKHIILNIDPNIETTIFLNTLSCSSFEDYIKSKYSNVKFGTTKNYKYYINCTKYDKDCIYLDKNKGSNKKYIAHHITDNLKKNPNVYFLTPLSKERYFYADILPFSNKKINSDIPVYVIQGSRHRRCDSLLIKILEKKYKYNFMIKILGRWDLDKSLEKFRDKLILKNDLNFVDFHREFLDCYCILPLITNKSHSCYYKNKMTSTINYAKGYKLKCLIDKDLQNIYNLDNVVIYNDITDITESFEKTLENFYNCIQE